MVETLFVYGTLRRDIGHERHRALARHSHFLGMAHYRGRLYDLGPYPALVPDPLVSTAVVGELYRVLRPSVLLPLLDRYEGCTAAEHPCEEYRRAVQPVQREGGEIVEAWMYLYNRPTTALRPIASGDYLRHWRSAAQCLPRPEGEA